MLAQRRLRNNSGTTRPAQQRLYNNTYERGDVEALLRKLDDWAKGHGIPERTRTKAALVFNDIASFRQHYGHVHEQAKVDTTWQSQYRASGEAFFKVLKEVAFVPMPFDQSLKAALRANKTPEDWTDYDGPSAALQEIIELHTQETEKDADANAAETGQVTLSSEPAPDVGSHPIHAAGHQQAVEGRSGFPSMRG